MNHLFNGWAKKIVWRDKCSVGVMDFEGHHHVCEVEGCPVHWVEHGTATDKPPLVLLHGLNDCHLTWKNLAPPLARERRVLIPDLPGHGLSGRPDASYELRWYARVMARWFEALALDTADVVGHSFGGGVALVMLLECPERIRRLVLVSSGGLGREIAVALRLASIPGVVERFGQPFMGPGTKLALKATCDVLSKDEIEALSAMNARRGSARTFARTVRDIINWRGQRHNFFKRARELALLPCIAVFWGDRDTIIPASHAQALADSVDGIRLKLFDGCGHYPHHERPSAFLDALLSFVDDPTVTRARLHEFGQAKKPRPAPRCPERPAREAGRQPNPGIAPPCSRPARALGLAFGGLTRAALRDAKR
ncbi:MAG: alpha/beta fold hydrolase [Polyangiaceae bacterium]|jgi:pimeloyl-ACP methyl ester carboxylesterase